MSNTDDSNDTSHHQERDIAIVSLDGGGPGVVSELTVLEEIVERFAYDSGTENYGSHPTKYWDLIGGVGFGGLAALLLGRLHLTLKETMDELVTIGRAIYPQGLHENTPEESTRRLRNAVEDLLRRNRLPLDIELRESRQPRCRVIVFAAPTAAMDHCQAFRTYKHRGKGLECTFVEAACAILAAPESFTPVAIGPSLRSQKFGGIPRGSINPTKEVFREAQRIFGDEKPVSLVLSLGSGQRKLFSSSESRITRIMHVGGIVERDLSHQLDSVPAYLRLNVDRGLETIENAHWHDIDPIITSTQVYLEMATITNFIDEAVRRVLRGDGSITLGQLVGLNSATKLRFDTRELDNFLKTEIKSIRDTLQGVAEKITLVDAIGTRIPIPLQLCGSYEMLTGIIRSYFEHCRPPGAGLVRQGHYQLVSGTQMEEVRRSQWTSLVAPGLTVEMSMIKHNRGNRDIACPKCGLIASKRNDNAWVTCSSCNASFQVTSKTEADDTLFSVAADQSLDESNIPDGPEGQADVGDKSEPSLGEDNEVLVKEDAVDEWKRFRRITVVNFLIEKPLQSNSNTLRATTHISSEAERPQVEILNQRGRLLAVDRPNIAVVPLQPVVADHAVLDSIDVKHARLDLMRIQRLHPKERRIVTTDGGNTVETQLYVLDTLERHPADENNFRAWSMTRGPPRLEDNDGKERIWYWCKALDRKTGERCRHSSSTLQRARQHFVSCAVDISCWTCPFQEICQSPRKHKRYDDLKHHHIIPVHCVRYSRPKGGGMEGNNTNQSDENIEKGEGKVPALRRKHTYAHLEINSEEAHLANLVCIIS